MRPPHSSGETGRAPSPAGLGQEGKAFEGPLDGPLPFLHSGLGASWVLRAREPLARRTQHSLWTR